MLLDQARILIKRCSRDVTQGRLYGKFFFAGYILELGLKRCMATVRRCASSLEIDGGPLRSPVSKGPTVALVCMVQTKEFPSNGSTKEISCARTNGCAQESAVALYSAARHIPA